MTAILSSRSASRSRLFRRYYEVDLPRVGQLNLDIRGRRFPDFFGATFANGGRYVEAWAGPLHVEFDYMPATKAKPGTFAFLALATVAAAGWLRCHLPS